MSDATLLLPDGSRAEVLHLDLEMHLRGAWTAIAELGADEELPTGAVTIEVAGAASDGTPRPSETFRGTVRPGEGGTFEGRARLFVVAGAGALSSPLTPRDFAGPAKARDVVRRLLPRPEQLAASVALTAWLQHWHVGAVPGSQALSLLADRLGLEWRVLADGSVWIGAEAWPDATSLLGFRTAIDREERVIRARPDAAALRPGQTVLGERIRTVRYTVGAEGLAVELGYGDERADFRRAVEGVLPPALYTRTYDATVEVQDEDGLLEVTADDAAIGGLSRVPLRVGIPGARVIVPEGSRVRLAFESASPERPYATGIDQDAGANRGVVRVDDGGTAGFIRLENTQNPAPQGVILSYRAPGALVALPRATLLGAITVAPSPVEFEIRTKAEEGSEEVMLRA